MYPMPSSGNLATAASRSLVEHTRERLSRELAASGASPEAVEKASHLFDPKGTDARLCATLRDVQAAKLATARAHSGYFVY